MKKILLVMSVAILIALCSAPSLVKADVPSDLQPCGSGIFITNGVMYESTIYCRSVFFPIIDIFNSNGPFKCQYGYGDIYFDQNNGTKNIAALSNTIGILCPTSRNSRVYTYNDRSIYVGNNEDTYYESIPEEFRPVPPIAQQRWDAFYEWYKNKFGFYPVEGSLIDLLRKLALGDEDANTEIIYPTFIPTPTPTPAPTPIPVQQIFVPDGNGNTTIIYQYTDPTTGVITQSPYNPNIENNIEINCNCDGDSGNGIFSPNPQDPTALTSSMLWADGFGVQITDNPLTAANDSQKSLAEAAAEYSDSVNVVSNSFNVLPFKWLALVGLLGGILIIAGLLRTFLGG